MERIVLEVKPGTSDKWERASAVLKRQAAEVVEQVLEMTDTAPATKERRRERIEALTSSLLIDLSQFKFDRNAANDYEE